MKQAKPIDYLNHNLVEERRIGAKQEQERILKILEELKEMSQPEQIELIDDIIDMIVRKQIQKETKPEKPMS